jgi:C4-dicarboxylate-specific signal transduction histidine kinase
LELKLQQANDQLERRVKERTGELESANEELLVAQEELHANNIELKIALETEKSLRDQLIQAEKFSALTRLVGSVAHEINNPLQTVKNCLYLIQSETDAAERNEALKMAVSETQRIGNLVQQLRQTYRPSSYEQVDFNLMDILNKVSVLLEPQFKQSHVIWQIHTLQDSITLHGVPDQIQQVFINICLNAIDAMCTTSGKLDLSISQPLDKKQVCISFHDTGTGIPLENQSRIFEPFFTTKVKGTGLGLAICYEIVKSHGGSISVESQPRQGTTFSVWLPVNS